MKFLRRFAAVLAVVAVVTLIGIAWDHLGPASLPGEGPTGGVQIAINGPVVRGLKLLKIPPGARPGRPGRPGRGVRLNISDGGSTPVDLGDLLKPVNLVVLRTTAVLEALIMAGVVILSIGARKWRRARRRKHNSRHNSRHHGKHHGTHRRQGPPPSRPVTSSPV